ncbi:MAG: Gfo/Idh/MocA family oxidoreductase [Candidatus Pseudobacter hemicellulosilyticus]|uniref:Gfo/Idh/MocA family oxidoreductase n=1 Tax=Candidatus Pseudobacter hemicellulosilyticus TaxID=3121375 RepID=A0AAJ5WNM7_9BACT|nr:MAG: Gfo/Idh/MocA family oxidoreductase [Pseudobacter sp.]
MPIKTALCSFGMSGRVFHAPFLSVLPGYELYAVWERSKQAAADHYPGIRSFSSYEALLADPAIELVVVNTPNYTHYEYTRQALEAGKHVLVEKPFTSTLAEALELQSLAQQKGLILSVYQNRRFDSDLKTVQRIAQSGNLGAIREAELHYDRYNDVLSPKQHKETPGPGTGNLYDLGPHIIDAALLLFGMPTAVFADLQTQRPNSRIIDYLEVLLYYPGLRVRLKSGYIVREPIPSFALHGTRGSFLKSRSDVQEAQLQAGMLPNNPHYGIEEEQHRGLLHTEINGTVVRELVPTERGQYGEFYEKLFKAITDQQPAPTTAQDGVNVMRIIDAALRSQEEKRIIDL